MSDDVLTSTQAAEILGVAPETVWRWAIAGDLHGWRTPGGHWRFHRSAIQAMTTSPEGSEDSAA